MNLESVVRDFVVSALAIPRKATRRKALAIAESRERCKKLLLARCTPDGQAVVLAEVRWPTSPAAATKAGRAFSEGVDIDMHRLATPDEREDSVPATMGLYVLVAMGKDPADVIGMRKFVWRESDNVE